MAGGGPSRSSDETLVMRVERRGWSEQAMQFEQLLSARWEGGIK